MLIISDTNILSSFAAGEAFQLLLRLFPERSICIPLTVQQELQIGLDRGRAYLKSVLQGIDAGQVQVLELSTQDEQLLDQLPRKLNQGEREAIILALTRKIPLLSNDKRAIRYCEHQGIEVVDLPELLRLLWTHHLVTRTEVERLIERMRQVENLILSPPDRAKIFTRSPRRRKG